MGRPHFGTFLKQLFKRRRMVRNGFLNFAWACLHVGVKLKPDIQIEIRGQRLSLLYRRAALGTLVHLECLLVLIFNLSTLLMR